MCARVCVCARSNKLASFIYQCHHPFTGTLAHAYPPPPSPPGRLGVVPGLGKFAGATPSVTRQTDLVRTRSVYYTVVYIIYRRAAARNGKYSQTINPLRKNKPFKKRIHTYIDNNILYGVFQEPWSDREFM